MTEDKDRQVDGVAGSKRGRNQYIIKIDRYIQLSEP